MADYKIMYHKLFNAMSVSTEIMKKAQLEAEEIYVNAEKNEVKLVPRRSKKAPPLK